MPHERIHFTEALPEVPCTTRALCRTDLRHPC